MSAFNKAGVRQTKSGIAKSAVADPQDVTLTNDTFEDFAYDGVVGAGKIGRKLAYKAGSRLTAAQFDALFQTATYASKTPATGPAAGGTQVTITGTELDGVTSVTFGGTAGTGLLLDSPTQIRVTTPAKTAGAQAVVIVDDGGNVSAGNFTFT